MLRKIQFNPNTGFNIININPMNCDIVIVEKSIMYLLGGYTRIIKSTLDYELSLNLFAKVGIINYIYNNLAMLRDLNLESLLFQLFLID